MRNKTRTYVLLALAMVIWGTIVYKIISGLNPNVPIAINEEFKSAFEPNEEKEPDSFSLKPIERDPFLGTLKTKKVTTAANRKLDAAEVYIPVVYHGLISKQVDGIKVFILSINGKQSFLKAGQEFNGVKLVRGDDKKIIVRYQNIQKAIEKI